MNRKRLLIILLGLLACSLAYAFWNSPRQQRATSNPSAARVVKSERRPGTSTAVPAAEDDLRVHLELMTRKEEKAPAHRRDLFAPLFSVRPPSPRVLPPPPPPVPMPAPTPAPAPMAVVPPPAPLPELARFTFLGFLQKEGEKTIFLSAGEEIFLVKKGDRFGRGKQFLITEMTPERLTIRQGDDPRPITLSLVEQAPLTPIVQRSLAMPVRPSGRSRLPVMPYRRTGPASPPVETSGKTAEMARAAAPAPDGSGEAPAPAPETPPEEGLLKPLPRSDFHNLFSPSTDRMPTEEKPVRNGSLQPAGEVSR